MRRSPRARTSLLVVIALAGLVLAGVPVSARRQPRVPITFSHGHVVDVQRLAGEPELKSDSEGNLYVTGPIGVQYAHSFLWKSEDDGDSWDLMRAFPPLQRPMPAVASGDASMAIVPGPDDGPDAVVWSDMVNLAGLQNAATFDGGNTFPVEYWNPFASDPGADRQWLDGIRLPGTETDRVYQVYNQNVEGLSVIYSDDYGQSWQVGQRNIDAFASVGNVAADPVKEKVYIAYANESNPKVAVAGLDATGFEPVIAGEGNGSVANLFVSIAVDTAGNPYVAWTEAGPPRGVYLASSTDGGKTWSDEVMVNPPNLKSNVFPWVVAGDPGRVWVVWYGAKPDSTPPENRGPWHLYGAQSLNALDGSPRFEAVRISEHAMHDNEICLSGIACTAGQGEDRNLLDDFTADIDPEGMLHVSYNDTNNQMGLSPDEDAGGAFVIHVRQESGPSLLEDVGTVIPRPAKPKILNARRKGAATTLTGTHSLPPGNWGVDLSGDANDPRHGEGGPGPNNPKLDLRSAWLEQGDGGSVVAHLKIGRVLLGPIDPLAPDGRTVLFQIFFWHGGAVYFAALEGVFDLGGGLLVVGAYAGEPFFIPNQSGIPKIAIYNRIPVQTGVVDAAVTPGRPGHIELTIPGALVGNPAPGDRFDQVTGFVQMLPLGGPPGTELLMDERDATPSTSWIYGDPRLPAGVIEVSVDDRAFRRPILADLTDYPDKKGWSARVTLAPGAHTLYVRQVVNGFASTPVAVKVA